MSFGTGRSQINITAESEFELLNHQVGTGATGGAITFFWITGDPLGQGPASAVDAALWRFYVDGEAVASVGPLPTALAALVGQSDPSAPFNNDFFGKNSKFGGWHFNLLVPFSVSIRVTLQMPSWRPWQRAFAMARGVENLPQLALSSLVLLPSSARLRAELRTSTNLPVLAFHEMVNASSFSRSRSSLSSSSSRSSLSSSSSSSSYPSSYYPTTTATPSSASLGMRGVLLGAVMDLTSLDGGSLNSLEGCFHAYLTPSTPFPGMLLGTGTEDYPESAFYFNSGPYRGPTSGLTVFEPGSGDTPSHVSFYKLHHRDPIFFNNDFRMEWRNGDITDPVTGEKCISTSGEPIGKPGVSNVTTLVYYYVW